MASRPNRWQVSVAAVLAGVVVLAALLVASRAGPDLEALRNDPMATWTPSGAELTRAHERESGSSLGKPGYAGITRVFRADHPRAAVTAARIEARRHGWRTEYERPGSFGAARQVPGWRLTLTVVEATVDGVPGNLFVYLDAYPA